MTVSDLAKIDHLHHAYIVVGEGAGAVRSMLEARGVKLSGNPDVLDLNFNELAVDDARGVAQYAFLKSVNEAKYFILTFNRANDQAQNALLKVIEDAPGNTHFFFCVDTVGQLIATVRSRCIVVGSVDEAESEYSATAREFIAATPAERLSQVEKIVKELQKTHDRTPARELVRALISLVHEKRGEVKELRALTTAYEYLRLSGSSPKIVLSHLAVALPSL